jgi:RNA polymerase sigma-70 factor (ECF subfamily)
VVAHICLDMLRSRKSRLEEPMGLELPYEPPDAGQGGNPEEEVLLAESLGNALLVVLDRLAPEERVALVLHDMFAVRFDEIAPIVSRSVPTTKKLASRALKRLRGSPKVSGAALRQQQQIVEAFLAASRAGDLLAVLALLAPDVVRRADRAALLPGRAAEVRGAAAVADEIMVFGRGARFAVPALVSGAVGALIAPRGRLQLVVRFGIDAETIHGYELIADPIHLQQLDLARIDP